MHHLTASKLREFILTQVKVMTWIKLGFGGHYLWQCSRNENKVWAMISELDDVSSLHCEGLLDAQVACSKGLIYEE
tara:strand:+ start:392 stop:619 length:228 start_codon:yes stop_codon:yes gene_type:complete